MNKVLMNVFLLEGIQIFLFKVYFILHTTIISDKNGMPFIKVKNNTKSNTKTKNHPAWKKWLNYRKNVQKYLRMFIDLE
ncbi:hypothetical protein ACO3VM_00300 [Methanocaldococcus sp. 10A]